MKVLKKYMTTFHLFHLFLAFIPFALKCLNNELMMEVADTHQEDIAFLRCANDLYKRLFKEELSKKFIL